jgi:2-dehydropantoate 2-reductase
MRIGIVGSGGVGGLLGGLLARRGADVALLARGAHGEALRSRGLRITSAPGGALGDFSINGFAVAESGRELGACDVVFVAVKTFQLEACLPDVRAMVGEKTVVVPLCNGLAAWERLTAALGEQRVAAGIIYVNSWVASPGVIEQLGPSARVVIGEGHGGASARLRALQELLVSAGLTCELAPDVQRRCWEKFLGFEPMAVVGALSRSSIGTFRAEPATRALLIALMEEVARLGRACGVELSDDAVDRRLAIIDGLAPDATISLQRDLMNGRPSELMEQSVELLARATSLEVAMPRHQLCVPLLALQERKARDARPPHSEQKAG